MSDLLHTDLAALRLKRGGIAGAFFVQGLVFISLTTRLPQVQHRFDLSSVGVSLLLLLVVLTAGAGSVGAETVARARDSAAALRAGLSLLAVGLLAVALAPALVLFAVGLGCYGLGVGAVDASSNMQAVALEHRVGRPVMPSFHGAWTAGGILATVLTIALASVDFEVATGVLVVFPLAMLAAPLQRRDRGLAEADPADLGVPWRRVVLIGLALVLFYMVDTAATTWGPVFLDHTFATPHRLVPLATLPYLVATLVVRFVGDNATARYGATRLVRVGGVVAAVGLAVIVAAPSWLVAILGFTIVGCGVAVIAPLSFSAAARVAGEVADPTRHRERVDAVIARFNQFNYVGALLGAVLTGLVGADSLRVGYAVPMVLILAIVPLARQFAGPAPRVADSRYSDPV
jgi:MFS family permease